MKRKILLLSVLFLTVLHTWAYDFMVNGIAYNITSSTPPYSVEVIDGGIYTGMITIPATVSNNNILYSVSRIGYHAFLNCHNLTSITIPNSVNLVYLGAFANCSGLTTITIPPSVTVIESFTFLGCSNLTSFHVQNTIPPGVSRGDNFDYDTFSKCTLYVPIGFKSAYQNTGVWGMFRDIVEEIIDDIQMVSVGDLSVHIQSGKVDLTNLSAGEKVQIFTTDGKMIFTENANEESLTIKLPANNIYIMKIGMKRAKIIM